MSCGRAPQLNLPISTEIPKANRPGSQSNIDYLVGGVTEFCYPLVAMGAKDKGEQHPPGARESFPTCRATILPTLNMNGWILVGAWGELASCRCDQNRGNRMNSVTSRYLTKLGVCRAQMGQRGRMASVLPLYDLCFAPKSCVGVQPMVTRHMRLGYQINGKYINIILIYGAKSC